MYVVFEGGNGVGKSTQLPLVVDLLKEYFHLYKKSNPEINYFHEGDTCNKNYNTFYEEVLDYALDRAKLQPFIKGEEYADITIGDRSYYSSLVYQGCGNPERMNYIRTVNQYMEAPEIIFYFTKGSQYLNQQYLDVIPYSKIYTIQTDLLTIEETTEEITEVILLYWLDNYTVQDDTTSIYDILKELKEKRGI